MLNSFAKYVVYDLLKLSPASNLSGALEFFIYDGIKIFILLAGIIFSISFIRSFFPPENTRKILSNKREFIGCGHYDHHHYGCRVAVQRHHVINISGGLYHA